MKLWDSRTVHYLNISHALGYLPYALYTAIGTLPRLEELHPHYGVVHQIFSYFKTPMLKLLHLERPRFLLGYALPPELRSTASLTSLHLENLGELHRHISPVEGVMPLIQWPVRLEHLKIHEGEKMSVPDLLRDYQGLLNVQKQSLKTISFTWIHWQGGPQMPDFSSFPLLEEVTLSVGDVTAQTPQNALQKLSAPSLRLVNLEYGPMANIMDSLFNLNQHAWFKDFAALWQKASPALKLEVMNLTFHVANAPRPEAREWPWSTLDATCSAVCKLGFELKYTPEGSYKEWLQEVLPDIGSR